MDRAVSVAVAAGVADVADRERRAAPRLSAAAAHGIVAVRIRPGCHAVLVDVSAVGACVETHRQLMPGTIVEVRVETEKHRTNVRGHIIRCTVSRLSASSISYHSAIAFDRHLPWFTPEHGRVVGSAEVRSGLPAWEDATRAAV